MSAAESNRDERLLTLVPQADDYLATATSGWPEPARRLYCWLYESGESGYVVAPPQQQLAAELQYSDSRPFAQGPRGWPEGMLSSVAPAAGQAAR